MAIVRTALRIFLSLPLAAFFGFVGWMKASAPVATLAQHGAWTVRIPKPLGRAVGVSEIVCTLLLLVGLLPGRARIGAAAALVLITNQGVAAAVHASAGESHALPQNAVLVTALGVVAWLSRRYFSVR